MVYKDEGYDFEIEDERRDGKQLKKLKKGSCCLIGSMKFDP